jgi:hypothetical protein
VPVELKLSVHLRRARWKVKIQEKESREPPHVSILRGTDKWRINLRTGALMDRRPKPSDIPQELLDLIQVHWRWLCEQWDAKYPTIRWRAVRSNMMTRQTATAQTFLLSKPGHKHSVRCFAPLQPEHVSSRQRVHEVVAQANSHSLWISDDKLLTDTLLNALASRTGSLGAMILLYQPTLARIPVLLRYFYRVVFGGEKDLLPPEELAEVLAAPNKADLFIGGIVDDDSKTLTLWRGDLTTLTVPFTAFPTFCPSCSMILLFYLLDDYSL